MALQLMSRGQEKSGSGARSASMPSATPPSWATSSAAGTTPSMAAFRFKTGGGSGAMGAFG